MILNPRDDRCHGPELTLRTRERNGSVRTHIASGFGLLATSPGVALR